MSALSPRSNPRAVPAKANLSWYQKRAKQLFKTLRAQKASARLAEAQLEVARESGFRNWRELHAQLSAVQDDSIAKLAKLFVNFAEQECKGSSPLYERLSRGVAEDPEILALAGLGKAPIPNLLFAAVHYLLMRDESAALRRYFVSLTESPNKSDAFSHFRQFCLRRRGEIAQIMRSRLVQTNEIARCGYLRPAFQTALVLAGGKSLSLIEIGASAGLNLCFDQYAYDYGDGTTRGNAASPIKLKIELRGATKPPLDDAPFAIRRRIGLDLNPIRAENRDDIDWLNALIWPEHADRRQRLTDALAIASRTDTEFYPGDAAEHLQRLLGSLDRDTLACVFQTHTFNQLTADSRKRIMEIIEAAGTQREIAFVSRHDRLTLDFYAPGKHEHVLLADTDGHGRWIEWKAAPSPATTNAALDPDLVRQFAEAFNRDRGDVDAIRALLDAHPELVHCQPWAPNWQHSAIEAAAHQCVWHRPKMIEIAQLLIDRGAVADLPTVARAGLLEEVKKRLDADPKLVNVPDEQNRTAIYRAACTYGFLKESIPVVEELIKRGAAIDIFTAASWLMIERLTPMLKQLPQLATLKDPEGLTALHWVTRTDPQDARQVPAAKLLLDAGADPNAEATGQSGMRPLHCAAEWASSTELAGLLIDRGAQINATSSQSDWTPLDYATDRNREAMRDYLRSRGGRTRQELAVIDDAAVDSFLKSVQAGDLATVTQRLDESPELVNRVGKHPQWGGRPQALHVAIETGNQAMFDLLIERNANPSGDNAMYDHWSPLMLAIHWKRDAMREALLKCVHHVSLIDALMMGDDATALKILQSGAIMLQRSMPNDATMLHFARTYPAAKRLIELGVPVDAKDKYGKTALDLAAEKGAAELVEYLLQTGAKASAVTFARLGDLAQLKRAVAHKKIEGPVLVAAIQSKIVQVVKWLIAQGADVNEPNHTGATPLHHAAFEGSLPIVKLLVKSGANVHAEDDEYNATPSGWAQHAAQNLNRLECADVTAFLEQQMTKKWDVKQLPERRQSHAIVKWKPIMDAAFDGDAKRIEKLIKEGADPNAVSTTPGAHRPLHRAIERKKTVPRTSAHERAVETLLKLGADPHARGGYGRLTALQMAAIDSPQFVPILIDHFKPLDLFHACVTLDLKRVETLLKKDKSLAKVRDENGYTGLHYVCASRMEPGSAKQLKLAQLLIDAGADVNATYAYTGGDWPIPVLYFACGFHDNPVLTELLLKAGAQPYDNESIYHASDEGHDACLAILEKYADKKKLKAEATKCLPTQMHWGKSRGAKWLLEHGANPNTLHPQSGNSALHSAARYGANEKVIALLLKHGADPTRKNKDGRTAIELATEAKKPRVVEQLKSGGRK